MPYQRVVLKLSGKALTDDEMHLFSSQRIQSYISDIRYALDTKGLQLVIVVGGGNVLRGTEFKLTGLNRATADEMGMLATVINGLMLRDVCMEMQVPAVLYTAQQIDKVSHVFDRYQADQDLTAGKVVICAGGMGNPFFTTDSAASLSAIQLNCDAVLKATNVDGVYSADPNKDKSATLYQSITFDEVLCHNLAVMDVAAFAQCRDHNIDIRVFNVFKEGALKRVLAGDVEGTLVSAKNDKN